MIMIVELGYEQIIIWTMSKQSPVYGELIIKKCFMDMVVNPITE